MRKQKVLAAAMAAVLAANSGGFFVYAADYPQKKQETVTGDYTNKTVILHSNDVHGQIDGYAYMTGLEKEFTDKGAEVIIADAGDFSQGDPYVSTTKGLDAITMMNAAGYDVITLGNHEFDYGYEQLRNNLEQADFEVLCADVTEGGKSIYDANYVYETKSNLKIGFFGMETPETQTKVNPALIQELTFLSNSNGKTNLYVCAQEQIDDLEQQGADVVVALTHLGVDEESAPDGHRSVDLYKNTKGIDIMLDGHSHTVMTEGENGEPIQSTGTKFENIGVVVIDDATKKIEDNYLIPTEQLTRDATVQAEAQKIMDRVDAEYGEVFAKSEVDMDGSKETNRSKESTLGDLITDAMVWSILKNKESLKVEEDHVVGVTNGGGIRAAIASGDITKKDIKTVLPFGNTLAVVYVTGEQLLEALEASTYCTPETLGGYPQTRGITFTLDTTKEYAKGALYEGSTYYGPASIQRVSIDKINGNAFSLTDTYAVITNNFCAAGGDTYYVFKENEQFDTGIVLDEIVMDYIAEELKGTITAEQYGEVRGDQTIITATDHTKALMQTVFGNLTKSGSGYSNLKKTDPYTQYSEALEDGTITITAKGEDINGTWTYTPDGEYITSTLKAEDYMGLYFWECIRDALAESLGMDVDLVGGYSSGIINKKLSSKYVIFEQDETAETFTGKLYAAGVYDMSEMDSWYLDQASFSYINALGKDNVNYIHSVGKLSFYAYGNKSSVDIYIAEHGGLTDLTYKSLMVAVKVLKPTGYKTFVDNYTELKEVKADGYQVSFVDQSTAPEVFSILDSHYKYLKLHLEAPTLNVGSSLSLKVGAVKTLKVSNGTVKSWASSKPSVATVKSGKVTALKKGTTTITAVLQDGTKLTCTVMVTSSPTLNVGSSLSLKAGAVKTLKVSNGTVKSWASSKPSVATVKSGKVTALKKGTTTITATLKDGTKLTCKVKVTSSPTITVSGKKYSSSTTYSVKKNGTLTVKITGKASAVNNTYASTKKSVAKVTSKNTAKTVKIKGLKKGSAKITINVNGVSFTIKVKVK